MSFNISRQYLNTKCGLHKKNYQVENPDNPNVFGHFDSNGKFIKCACHEHITEEKLVSIDFNHNPFSAIVDASLTCVIGKNMGKISAWYDNEWGFSNRMCDIAKYIHKI